MSNTKTTDTIKIISRHATLSEAVEASGMDLSYNEAEAKRTIRQTEHAHRDGYKSGEAFVTDDGVYYVYHADIKILHKFYPFCSMLTDSPFSMFVIGQDDITRLPITFPKTSENRRAIRKMGILVG